MPPHRIYLARHGKIEGDEEKRYIGQSDWELSQVGLMQAERLHQTLRANHLEQIYCSSLRRTRQTAEIIAADRELMPVALLELQELNMGDWEGVKFADIRANYPEEFERRGEDLANFRPTGGESFTDLYERVIPVFQHIMSSARKDILMVAHAGVNRVILAHALGLPLSCIFRFKQDYGCLNVIRFDGQVFCVEKLNWVPSPYFTNI